jgi:hypothetical protein
MSVGASSNAMSYLQSLLQQGKAGAGKTAGAADPLSMLMQATSEDGSSPNQGGSAATSSGTAANTNCPPFGSDTMAALISMQGQATNSQSPSPLFAKLDADSDGQISKSEFMNAANKAGADSSIADAVFAKIDANGDGSVSQSELAKVDHGGGHHHHMHAGGGGGAGGGSGQGGLDALLSSAGADGATTQTSTNADGSTTTTISYADGTKIDVTTPAKAASSDAAPDGKSGNAGGDKNSANLLEQLIKLQSQIVTAATSTLSAIV